MGENKCYVFVDGNMVVIKSNGNIVLPSELAGYPIMINNENGTKVIISEPIKSDSSRALMRACIMDVIETYRNQEAVPRLDFPRWNEMIIYPVVPEAADEEYWCPEQLIDSFLNLYGPEFIL